MRLDGYIRVSKVGERSGESFLSPDEQRSKIEQYAKLHGIRLTMHEPELDESGGTMRRPIFDGIMDRIRAGQSDGLIVAKLDRFARTVVGGVEVMAELAERGKVLVSVTEQIDLSTSMGKLVAHVMIAFAELERDRLRESWRNGQRSKIERGIHGASPIYGYVKVNGRPLTVDPETAPHVRTIFRLRADGWSPGRIAKRIEQKAPLPSGRKWTPRKVSQIVANRAYLGHAYYGDIENRDAHPAIVTLDEFDAAQVAGPGRNHLKREQGLLTGIIRCAGCRYAMRPRHETREDGRVIPGYVCAKHHGGGECPEPTAIAAHLIDPAVLTRGGMLAFWTPQSDDELDNARRALTMAEDKMREFLADKELRQIVGEPAYLAEAKDRRAAVDDAQAAVEALLRSRKPSVPTDHEMSEAEVIEFLRFQLESVYVRKGKGPIGERVLVFERGEDKLDKPKRGSTEYKLAPVPWPVKKGDELWPNLLVNQEGGEFQLVELQSAEGIYCDGRRFDTLEEFGEYVLRGASVPAKGRP
jgi:DNA invertase Pin-like site-specific DNA recombinase